MRILLISNAFYPDVFGGSDIAASSLGQLLVAAGHESVVMTLGAPGAKRGWEEPRREIPRYLCMPEYPYPYRDYHGRGGVQKLKWHFRDHFHHDCTADLDAILADFQPDIVNVHNIQGMGYALLETIGKRGLPVVYTLHDLHLACINMSMYRGGAECPSQCLPCRFSHRVKAGYLDKIRRLTFCSPSQALLDRLAPWLPAHARQQAIPYPLLFAAATAPRPRLSKPHLIFAGRVDPSKGVAWVCEILAELALEHDFHFTVLGGGTQLEELRALYGGKEWITFAGLVKPEEVGNYLASADVMLVPSLWLENSPLVIYQAISLALPILGNRTGGIGELIAPGVNGDLLPKNGRGEWRAKLVEVFTQPALLQQWRAGAEGYRSEFAAPRLAEKVATLFQETAKA